MPVILEKEFEEEWLNPDTEIERLRGMLVPFPDRGMTDYPVSSLVNTPKNQGDDIIKPLSSS